MSDVASIHVVWDWNGTLLDDTDACVASLNEMLTKRGAAPVTRDFFKANFVFPSRKFYNQIGMEVADADWDDLAREYYRTYERQARGLNGETQTALKRVQSAGCRQSVLSALRQDLLEQSLAYYAIRPFFTYVYGTDNLDGASKLDRARELKAELSRTGSATGRIVMVGDAIHDKEVADALGFDCVLCAQGSHSYERLAAVAPTGHTLLETLALIGI